VLIKATLTWLQLSVDDDAFWEAPTEIRPLALGKLPALQQVGAKDLMTNEFA
jgi:hypothetical protein